MKNGNDQAVQPPPSAPTWFTQNIATIKDIAALAQSIVLILAVVAGGIWTINEFSATRKEELATIAAQLERLKLEKSIEDANTIYIVPEAHLDVQVIGQVLMNGDRHWVVIAKGEALNDGNGEFEVRTDTFELFAAPVIGINDRDKTPLFGEKLSFAPLDYDSKIETGVASRTHPVAKAGIQFIKESAPYLVTFRYRFEDQDRDFPVMKRAILNLPADAPVPQPLQVRAFSNPHSSTAKTKRPHTGQRP